MTLDRSEDEKRVLNDPAVVQCLLCGAVRKRTKPFVPKIHPVDDFAKEYLTENATLRADVEKWRIAEGEAMLVVESQDLRLEKLQADLAEAQRERLHTVGICEEEVKDVRAENERLRKALDNWAYLQTKLEAAHKASEEGP